MDFQHLKCSGHHLPRGKGLPGQKIQFPPPKGRNKVTIACFHDKRWRKSETWICYPAHLERTDCAAFKRVQNILSANDDIGISKRSLFKLGQMHRSNEVATTFFAF